MDIRVAITNKGRCPMVMVKSGNDAFAELVHRLSNHQPTQAVSLEQDDENWLVALVTTDGREVIRIQRQAPGRRGEVAKTISQLRIPNPTCLLSITREGPRPFGWVVVDPLTLEHRGESTFYRQVV